MAIGSHELLLIVRAQNQASAALGRVSRDLRRMAAQRDLEMRRAAIANRLARNNIQQMNQLARIESVLAHDGAQRLAHNQALARNAYQQMNIQDRISNLEVRRTGVARAFANLETQKLRMMSQELRLQQSLEKIELRRQGINSQIGRLNTQFQRNLVQQQALARKEFSLGTQLMERQLRLAQANRRVMAVSGGDAADPAKIREAQIMADIARRRVRETQMAQGGIPGQRKALGMAAGDIARQTQIAKNSLQLLQNEELQVAKAADILTSRQKALAIQFQNVAARGQAVNATERQLKAELKLVTDQIGILNARWEQNKIAMQQAAASIGILRTEEAALNAQLAEQNALLAGQNRQRWADSARAVSHFGRVMQMTGLIATAAFGAMAIGAAHFNREATRVATQTGPIGSGTGLIVKNADRASQAIIQLMKEVPANQQQLTDSLYNIYSSMQVSFGGGVKLLKIFAQTWEAGGMLGDVNEVADALITLGNNWQIAGDDTAAYKKIAASTLATVRFGRLTVEQYTGTMNQLAPAFKGAHQSIEEMNGAIAFMTRLLPSQRMSAAGLARFMEIIGRFAAKPAAGFEELAKDIQDAQGNLKPLSEIMDIFINQFPQLKTSGVFLNNFIKMISNQQGTVQARRALQGLVMQNELYDDTLKNTTDDVNEFNRSLRAMEKSTGVKWEQFINNMRALALEIGAAALPALIKFGSIVQRVTKWYDGLDKSTKNSIATFGAYAAIGLLLGGVFLSVVGSIAAMILSIATVGKALGGVSKLLGKAGAAGGAKVLAQEAGFLSLRMGAIGAAIGIVTLSLMSFHDQIIPAINAVGGFHSILKVLSILMGLWTVQQIVNGFLSITTQADAATGAAKRTRVALLGLNGLTIAVILAIGITESPQYKAFRSWVKEHGGGAADALFSNLGDQLKSFGKTTKHAYDLTFGFPAYAKKMDKQAALEAARANINLPAIWRMVVEGTMNMANLRRLKPFIDSKNYEMMMIYARALEHPKAAGTHGEGRAGSLTAQGGGVPAAAMDAAMMRNVRRVATLQEAFDKAATPANYRKMLAGMKKATADYTKEQKEMFDALLSAFKKADPEVKKITDSQALAMQRNIKRLEAVAQKTGALKDYMAVQKAMAALSKVATSEQMGALSSLMQMEDEAAAKRKQKADEALQKAKEHTQKMKELHRQNMENARNLLQQTAQSIMQKLESFTEEGQQMLGQLFSGRFITTSSTVLDRQQFGFALRPEDIMKDLKMQVADLQKFSGTLDQVAARGAPEEMMKQLMALGPAAQDQIALLLKFTPAEFKQYVAKFNEGQREVEKFARSRLMAELEKWKMYGKAVQLAIINGMQSEDVATSNAIDALVAKMFPGLTKQSGKLAPKTVGGNVVNNYNITAGDASGVKTAIKEAQFKFKNRKPPLM